MKKIIIALMALAATTVSMAKTADELRVYINPGHGSWTPNDRPNPIVGHGAYQRNNTDTTNFFESNTNLRKGFGVLEKLRVYGLKFDPTLNQEGDRHMIGAARDMSNNIVMSHVKCGPYHDDNGTANQLGDATPADIYYYNRNLSEICAEVEANHFDMFISIHSNAATEGTSTNFPLFLYRGYDTPNEEAGVSADHQTTSRAMADACWGYAIENPHMMWTSYSATSKNLRGDINFYGSSSTGSLGYKGYLGVLKHGAPGFLVEGYFHTYQAARHRAMNWDVDYMEGAAYAHGIADYFGLTKEKTGDIYGIVRDANERFTDQYYKPNTATLDRFMPLNGCTVVLNKDGKEVARYVTDNNYNGAFVFKNVEPGTYTITFESEQYLPCDPVEVTVEAAQIAYPTAQLVNKDWTPPTVVYENYPDPLASISSLLPATEYNVAAEYTDEPIEGLEGKLIRRAVVREGKMYILALDKPIEFAASIPVEEQAKATIIVYDLAKKAIVANVSTEGAAGSVAAISDIQVTADGYLLASNSTKMQNSDNEIETGDAGRGLFVIYKWTNDENGLPTGNPAQWLTHNTAGLWYRAYPSHFAYTGTTQEGTAVVDMPTTGASRNMRATVISVVDGNQLTSNDFRASVNNNSLNDLGADMTLITSPLADDRVIMLDSKKGAQTWTFSSAIDGNPLDQSAGNEAFANADGRAGFFHWSGASFVVMPYNVEGVNKGLQMVNITKSLAEASAVSILPAAELAEVATTATAAAGEVEVTRDDLSGAVNNYWMNLYLLRDGKVTKFTTKNVAQPQGRREYAYDLASQESDDNFELSFKLTGDAADANLVLTPAEGEGENIVVPLGALAKGENTQTVAKADLDPQVSYNWSIEVVSEPIAQAGLAYSDPSGLTTRGGVIAITDPEYASFGYVAVGHGRNAGIDIYNPAGEKVATRILVNHKLLGGVTTNQSNPFRGNEHKGYAVFSTWGDSGYGMVAVNPLDPTEEPFTLFAGDKQGAGHFMYNGVNLGGGNAGFDFVGTGDNTCVISFSEDHEGLNGSGSTENSLVRYRLGSGWQITEAPVILGYKGLLANTNVDIVAYGNGVFAAQVRGAGNNAVGTPCFAYIANVDGDSHACVMTSADEDIVDYLNDGASGVAITTDGKTLAASAASSIVIYDVEWNDNTPKLTYKYSFPIEKNGWSSLRFDAAGNLHAYMLNGGYRVYSLPDARPTAVTPAASVYLLKGAEGIREITAEEATSDADAVYYNLQGVRVAAEYLTPGIYVKVAGSNATKVLVK